MSQCLLARRPRSADGGKVTHDMLLATHEKIIDMDDEFLPLCNVLKPFDILMNGGVPKKSSIVMHEYLPVWMVPSGVI